MYDHHTKSFEKRPEVELKVGSYIFSKMPKQIIEGDIGKNLKVFVCVCLFCPSILNILFWYSSSYFLSYWLKVEGNFPVNSTSIYCDLYSFLINFVKQVIVSDVDLHTPFALDARF